MATTDSTTTPSDAIGSGIASSAPANSSGFYRLQGGQLQFAPNAVHAPEYTLSRHDRARTALPKDGWDWFDSREAASAHHNLPVPASQPEPWQRSSHQPGGPAQR